MQEGWLYDGTTGLRRPVAISAGEGRLRVELADGSDVAPPPNTLTHVESRGEWEVYGRPDIQGWRLGIPAELARELGALLPGRQRYGRWIDRVGLVPAIVVGVAVSALVIVFGSHFPVWAAPYVPASWEKKFGDALVGDFGGKFCKGAEGQAALNKLAAELSPRGPSLNIRVVDIPMVNAAALPGGNIVVFDKLLKEADGPDELAGILGHEIAHIEERHVTQSMIREFGFDLIVTGLGGTAGANADALLAARYSRGSEGEADADAVKMLERANISPGATAGFFQRVAKQESSLGAVGTGLSYLSTHPVSAERERLFRGKVVRGHTYRPALTDAEWQALRSICDKPVRPAA
jgi:Zn-dependent protease with chaperone function